MDSSISQCYNSSAPEVKKQQLVLIKSAGIDFVVISWWGYNESDRYQNFVDKLQNRFSKLQKTTTLT